MTGVPPSGSGHSPRGEAAISVASPAKPSVPNAATIADKLDEARALIERGWTQGKFRKFTNDGVCYCADGALSEVFRLDETETYKLAVRPLQQAMGVREHAYMWAWNDDPERTQAEVIDAFKRAAELARAGDQ